MPRPLQSFRATEPIPEIGAVAGDRVDIELGEPNPSKRVIVARSTHPDAVDAVPRYIENWTGAPTYGHLTLVP